MLNKMSLGGSELSDSTPTEVYTIMNKDRELGTFVWDDSELPRMKNNLSCPSFIANDIESWILSRTPPKHRANIKLLLTTLGLQSPKDIIDLSKGLSLIDTLWVRPASCTDTWSEMNLFDNDFNDVISRIAFDGGLRGRFFSTTSPEYGTDGMLAKCWCRDSVTRHIYLYKAGTTGASNAGNEPYAEAMSSQVLDALGYRHVPYSLQRYRGKLVSVCPLMTSKSKMMLPAHFFLPRGNLTNMLEYAAQNGLSSSIAQMLCADYILANTDRHLSNFSLFLDSETFKVIDFCDIYDNGAGMLCYWNGRDDIDEYTKLLGPCLYGTFEQGALSAKKILGNKHNVQSLIGFKFDRAELLDMPAWRIDALESWLQRRVRSFLAL